MDFVIVTGMSGAGKSRAINAMEDIGFYCVDNMPAQLIPVFYDLCSNSKEKIEKVAVVTDIRGGSMFNALLKTLENMKQDNKLYKILFLDAKDNVLINRYKETRRRHPLSNYYQSIHQAVLYERNTLKHIYQSADYVIDTSLISPSQLKDRIVSIFLKDLSKALMINCVSFGFKYGLPNDADLVFDVRCLPNPFYIDNLKNLTGLDQPVKNYVMKFEQTNGFKERLISLIDYMLPLYMKEGKSQLVIAIGCTGGKHRSVALAQFLFNYLTDKGNIANVQHRDIKKP